MHILISMPPPPSNELQSRNGMSMRCTLKVSPSVLSSEIQDNICLRCTRSTGGHPRRVSMKRIFSFHQNNVWRINRKLSILYIVWYTRLALLMKAYSWTIHSKATANQWKLNMCIIELIHFMQPDKVFKIKPQFYNQILSSSYTTSDNSSDLNIKKLPLYYNLQQIFLVHDFFQQLEHDF